MDRELVLLSLALLLGGPLSLLFGLWPSSHHRGFSSALSLEKLRWRQLWLPLLPAALALFALLGWALYEPENAEALPVSLLMVAGFFSVLWLRALCRALHRLFLKENVSLAGTVGLFRPAVIISQRLTLALDPEALSAVQAHEVSHQRHKDPLRIWLAYLATDLQWPSSSAKHRLLYWRFALELARDDEARSEGVDGAALATAILTAARLTSDPKPALHASLLGTGEALQYRIERLLAPLPEETTPPKNRWHWVLLLLALSTIILGAVFGEELVRCLLAWLS